MFRLKNAPVFKLKNNKFFSMPNKIKLSSSKTFEKKALPKGKTVKIKVKTAAKKQVPDKSAIVKAADKPKTPTQIATKPEVKPSLPAEAGVNAQKSDSSAAPKVDNKSLSAKIVLQSITENEKEESAPKQVFTEKEAASDGGVKLPLSAKLAIAKDINESHCESEEAKNQPVKNTAAAVKEENEENGESKKRPVNIYRRIAYIFSLATVILLAVIFYFSVVKVTISISPQQEHLSGSLIVDVYDKDSGSLPSGDNIIEGSVKELEIEQIGEYSASGTEVIGKEVTGRVNLINNYDRSQQLVATTRLLSPDNKLFRLKNTVTVPAGGQIEAEVYADEPSREAAIAPATFKIPGLWAGLQEKIYAESKEPMIYAEKVKKHIQQSDIDGGVYDLKQKLLEKAKNEISGNYQNYDQVLYNIDESSTDKTVSGEAGDEQETFTITMKTKVVVAAFKDEKIYLLAQKKLAALMPDDKKLADFEKSKIKYALNGFDAEGGTAAVSATFTGDVSLKDGNNIIDKEKIIGLNRGQLEAYLNGVKEIGDYEIKFYPSFINKVPNLVDRIEIIMK